MNKVIGIGLGVLLTAATLGMVGCGNHVKRIGSIGDREFIAVRTTDVSGPNGLLIIAVDPDGTQTPMLDASTGGILNSAVSSTGNVLAAEAFDAGDQSVNASNTSNTRVNVSNRRLSPLSDRPPVSNRP